MTPEFHTGKPPRTLIRKPPRILALSTGQVGNIGDICFTPALLALCRDHCPGIPVDVTGALWRDPAATARVRRDFPEANIIEGHLWDWDTGAPTPAVATALDRATLLLHGSGPWAHFGVHRPRDWDYLMGASLAWWLAADRGLPFGLLGHSFEGFAFPSDAVMRQILPRAAFVFPRETDSLRLLQEQGFGPAQCAFVPDCAWAFEGRDPEGADAFLERCGLGVGRRFVVAGSNGRSTAADLAVMAGAIDRIVCATGLDVLLGCEGERTLPAMREKLVPLLSVAARAKVHVPDAFWSAEVAASVCQRAATVVAGEIHLTIIAAGAGTPVVHHRHLGDRKPWASGDPAGNGYSGEGQVQADGRKAQVFADLGLADWCLTTADGAAAIAGMAISHINEASAARQRCATAVATARGRLTWAMGIAAACAVSPGGEQR